MKKKFSNKLLFLFVLLFFCILINFNSVRAESIVVTSSTYNKEFIDSYIDAGQSPFDAFEIIVDYYNENYSGTLNFTSADLPAYAVLIETFDSTGNSNGYDFVFSEYPYLYRDSNFQNRRFLFSM